MRDNTRSTLERKQQSKTREISNPLPIGDMMHITWNDLNNIMIEKAIDDSNFMSESVTIYDRSVGEYYPAGLLEFQEGDDILDDGGMFITIDT